MKRSTSRFAWLVAILWSVALVAAACGSDDGAGGDATTEAAEAGGDLASVEGSVVVSGSSTVEPVSAAAAEIMNDAGSPIEVTVDGPGTGDGFALFCAGDTDISDASRPIKDEEAADCEAAGIEYVELKVAYDGIAVLTNPANEAVECLTTGDIYALMGPESEGFSSWADANTISAELGGTGEFPDAPFDISAPGPESGTYDSFIEIVLEGIAEDERGQESFIRTDFSGNPDDNVLIQGIQGSDTSFGWVGFAFADENADSVKTLGVDAGDGCVQPTIETIADASYPVSRALYIYVNTAKAAENPAIVTYVDYYLNDAYEEAVTKAFGESGYVPLPDAELEETRSAWTGR